MQIFAIMPMFHVKHRLKSVIVPRETIKKSIMLLFGVSRETFR